SPWRRTTSPVPFSWASLGSPANGIIEIGGPEAFRLDDLVRRALRERSDTREVVADPHARYYGIAVQERTLVPDADAWLGKIRFYDWMREHEGAGTGPASGGNNG